MSTFRDDIKCCVVYLNIDRQLMFTKCFRGRYRPTQLENYLGYLGRNKNIKLITIMHL